MIFFYNSVLACCIVTTLSASIPSIFDTSFVSFGQANIAIPELRTLSYDEMIDLLHLIESDSFEENCSLEKLAEINGLLSFLALEGAIDAQVIEVQDAVATLYLNDFSPYVYAKDFSFHQDTLHVMLCKSWCAKKWQQTKHFVKKHKKEILIGTIVVVAVAAIAVTAVALSAASVAAAGAAAASGGSMDDNAKNIADSTNEALLEVLDEQITTFKETVAAEHLDATQETHLSLEERGRMLGSLFTHQAVDSMTPGVENRTLNPWLQLSNASSHGSIDRAFSTDYALACLDEQSGLNTLAYKMRGETALMTGYYEEAVDHFTTALTENPHQPDAYLGRGMANFQRGAYEDVVTDYVNYRAATQRDTSWTEFSYGFAHGLPVGIYDSGEGLVQFVAALSSHPIDTGKSVGASLVSLAGLVHSSEWATIGATLSPELHELIIDWDNLSSYKRGELAGYAFGKNGADILLPGCAVKAVARGAGTAKNVAAICKNLKVAERTLVLEAAAEASLSGVNIGEVVMSAERTMVAAEELGLTGKEMSVLQEAGTLKQQVVKGRDFFEGNPKMQASYDLFDRAQKSLESYIKQPMAEIEIKKLIHECGVQTFPRPVGIPQNYLVRITEKGAGIEYVDPIKSNCSIRVMPGKVHTPNPLQQKPYVVRMVDKKAVDKNGNLVSPKSPEAHIPLEEFVYLVEVNHVPK